MFYVYEVSRFFPTYEKDVRPIWCKYWKNTRC